MKVKELIEILQCEDQEAKVKLRIDDTIDMEGHLTNVLSDYEYIILEGE